MKSLDRGALRGFVGHSVSIIPPGVGVHPRFFLSLSRTPFGHIVSNVLPVVYKPSPTPFARIGDSSSIAHERVSPALRMFCQRLRIAI
jgi:hypothetical protein